MGQRVMRVGDADFRIGPPARLAGKLECDHPGHVALESKHLKIEHQPRVVGVGRRHADRPVEIRQRVVLGVDLGHLNAALDLTHRGEVLADPGTVGRAQRVLQPGDFIGDRVEKTRPFLEREPGDRRPRLPPSPKRRLEDDARGGLPKAAGSSATTTIGCSGSAQALTVIALADGREEVHRHLERRQLDVYPDRSAGRRSDLRSLPR